MLSEKIMPCGSDSRKGVTSRSPSGFTFSSPRVDGRGTPRRSGLRHCAKNRKVAGSIPDGIIGIFHWHIPSGPGVDSVSNRNEYQEYFLGGNSGRCVDPTTLQPSCVDCHKNGSLSLSRPVQEMRYLYVHQVGVNTCTARTNFGYAKRWSIT